MFRDTWVLVELEELECRWRWWWPRLAMDVCMDAICCPMFNISVWKSSNCSSSLVSTRWNCWRMPCWMRQCWPRVMYSSSPSKIGSSSSLEVPICAREPLPLIITEQNQVKCQGSYERRKGGYLSLPLCAGFGWVILPLGEIGELTQSTREKVGYVECKF